MKQALKSKKVYIIAAILVVIGFIPFVVAMILSIPELNATLFYGYPYVNWAVLAFYFLVGYIWGDLHQVKIRRNTKNWDGKLDEKDITNAWKRRLPFWFAAAVLVILVLTLEIIALVNGYYPFTR